MLERTVSGRIADAIARLAQDFIQELYPEDGKGTVDLYWEMITGNPVIGAAVEAKVLFGIRQIGDFQHENPDIQDFIHRNFAQMDGSIGLSIAELYSALPIGWGFSEIAIREPEDSSYLLESLMLVDHRYHTFEGRKGQVENVIYRPPGRIEERIPYSKGVHVINKPHLARREPYGIADCKAAVAAWKAWKIIMNQMLIAGQRQATPILVGKAPRDGYVQLTDSNGVPLRREDGTTVEIKATHALAENMAKLEKNGGVVTVDTDHEIDALQQQTDGKFFMLMLTYLEKLMLRAFLVPETMFSVGEGGLGNAGIAQEHRESFELHLKAIATQIKEQLIENLIRPLIAWEFGEQEDYGTFAEPPHDDEDALDLLGKLTQAFSSGVYSTADIQAVNRHRQLAGIPPIEEVAGAISDRATKQPATEPPSLDEVSSIFSFSSQAKFARNCKKGLACGNSCISKTKTCRKKMTPQQSELKNRVVAQASPSGRDSLPDDVEVTLSGESAEYVFTISEETGDFVILTIEPSDRGTLKVVFETTEGFNLEDGEEPPEGAAFAASRISQIFRADVASRPEGTRFETAPDRDDTRGDFREAMYARSGFSFQGGGTAPSSGTGLQAGVVSNGRLVPSDQNGRSFTAEEQSEHRSNVRQALRNGIQQVRPLRSLENR